MTATPQPRSGVADQLDRLTPRLDELTYRARLGTRSDREFNELEETAQAIARDLVAAFRGPTATLPVNPPLFVRGNQAGW